MDPQPDTRAVVCLHGLGRSPSDWDGVRDGLAPYGSVLTPALPRSIEAGLTVARDATPAGSVIVGHSMGGVLALRLASEGTHDVRGVVLTNCFFPPARNGRSLGSTVRDYGAHRLAFLRARRTSARPEGGGAALGLVGLARLAAQPGGFAALERATAARVLVVHSRDDHYVPVEFALAAVARNPAWEACILDRGGHHAHLDAPEDWHAGVTDWLGGR